MRRPLYHTLITLPSDSAHTTMENDDHFGAFTYTDGALKRIETPNGYRTAEGTRYYVNDYQGNVRQVTDSIGTVLQDNHYYPYGMLMGESSDVVAANRAGRWSDGGANPYRYSGNELLTLRNMHLGDYHARIYDYATGRFLQPDPLRHKYTHLTSYLYCAANPVSFIDPLGMKVELAGTIEERISLLHNLHEMKKSGIFSHVYNIIQGHKDSFIIRYGEVPGPEGANYSGCLIGNTIIINKAYFTGRKNEDASNTIGEETFHVFQRIEADTTENNIEFEAKTIAILETLEMGLGLGLGEDLKDWGSYLQQEYNNLNDFITGSEGKGFIREYISSGKKFVNNHLNDPDSKYHQEVNMVPNRVLNLLEYMKQAEGLVVTFKK